MRDLTKIIIKSYNCNNITLQTKQNKKYFILDCIICHLAERIRFKNAIN